MSKKRVTKKQRRKKKLIIFIIEIVVLLLLLGVLFVALKLLKINREGLDTENLGINEDIDSDLLSGYTNIALFGLDNRDTGNYDGGNSDCIMIASINNTTKEVKLVSVYRDTYLNRTDDTYRKANAAYAQGGAQEAIQMLNMNLDLDIQDYVAVDFEALIKCIDLVGGLEIDVTSDEVEYINVYITELNQLYGTSSSLISSAGTYTLDGVQATAYCRIRYTSGGDFERASRQRIVLSKLAEKAKSSNLSTINKIVDEMMSYISTSLSNAEILSMASALMDYNLSGTAGFPFDMATETISSKTGSVVVPCTLESNVSQLFDYLYDESSYTPSNTVQGISQEIEELSGYDETDAVDYGYGIDGSTDSTDTSDSEE